MLKRLAILVPVAINVASTLAAFVNMAGLGDAATLAVGGAALSLFAAFGSLWAFEGVKGGGRVHPDERAVVANENDDGVSGSDDDAPILIRSLYEGLIVTDRPVVASAGRTVRTRALVQRGDQALYIVRGHEAILEVHGPSK